MSAPPFLELPAGATARTVSTARGTFASFMAGPEPAEARGTVLLVPGITGSKEDFIAVLEPIGRAGFRVVAYDQRGQYETPADQRGDTVRREAATDAEPWTVAGFAADLLSLVQALGHRPVHVVGHSFGGIVARAAVIAEPALFSSLILLDSGPAAVPARHAQTLIQLAALLDAQGLGPVWEIRQAADRDAGVAEPDDPQVREFLRRRFFANDPESLAGIARLLATEPDRTEELAATGVPVLVAFGANDLDSWDPEIQVEVASRLGVPYVSFPEAAHSPAAESPTDTALALVSFWSGLESAG